MKLKSFFIACFLITSLFAFSQDEEHSKWGYHFIIGVGNSMLEHNQQGIINADVISIKSNVEYKLTKSENTKLIGGIDFYNLNAGLFDGSEQYKLMNQYIQVPLKIAQRFNFKKDTKLSSIIGAGMYSNFLISSKIKTLNESINTKSNGSNFGFSVFFGMEYQLSSNTSIGIYGDVMNELSAIKKNGIEQQQNEIFLFNVGFSRRF